MASPTLVDRSTIWHFGNVGTTAAPDWERIGNYVESASLQYGTKTETYKDITKPSETTEITGHNVSMPVNGLFYPNDPIFDFIDEMRRSRKILTDASMEICHVWGYMKSSGTPAAWPAEKATYRVAWESIGDNGAEPAAYNVTFHEATTPVFGTFEPVAKTFTPTTTP